MELIFDKAVTDVQEIKDADDNILWEKSDED